MESVPLGIIPVKDTVFLYQKETTAASSKVCIYESSDGQNFSRTTHRFSLKNIAGKKEKQISHIPKLHTPAVIAPDYTHKNTHVLYWGDTSLHLGFSENFTAWRLYDDPIYEPRLQEQQTLVPLNCFVGKDEIFVVFAIKTMIEKESFYSLSVAIFQKENPGKIAWRLQYPFWVLPETMAEKHIVPVGIIETNGIMQSYWYIAGGEIVSFPHKILSKLFTHKEKLPSADLFLKKADANPILAPDPAHVWESQAVFNPTAIYEDEKVHLLYRAVGHHWTSSFGYASSNDGIHIDNKSALPAYIPRKPFEGAGVQADPNSLFNSGPGNGGCEDPRLTRIEDKVYLTYVAYNGVTGPRVALSSIKTSDFLAQNWNWSEPALISRPDVIDKNACIFPEKIGGKYAIMHRVFPNILIDFVDTLDFDGNTFLKGEYRIVPRRMGWDSRKVGAGPAPLRTPYGWLLIYHAVDDKDDGKYQIGAMLLDLDNPLKILHRSIHPIISPTNWYENQGHKSGIVYPCGAVIVKDTLHVYYGGADTYVCAATANINDFLYQLTYHDSIKMDTIQIQ